MNEFNFLNYHTRYSSDGDLHIPMQSDACFQRVFDSRMEHMANTYQIVMYVGADYLMRNCNNNACFLDKDGIRRYVKLAQAIHPFGVRVSDYPKYRTYSRYCVTLEVEGPKMFHEYLLTWTRYLYEFPFSVCLLDAYKLKEEPRFRFTSIADLMNLILACIPKNTRPVHCIVDPRYLHERLTVEGLRKKLAGIRRLNDLYKQLKEIQRMESEHAYDLDYWKDKYEERKPFYIKVYDEIVRDRKR